MGNLVDDFLLLFQLTRHALHVLLVVAIGIVQELITEQTPETLRKRLSPSLFAEYPLYILLRTLKVPKVPVHIIVMLSLLIQTKVK